MMTSKYQYFVAALIYAAGLCSPTLMAQDIYDVEVQDAELDCRDKGGGVIFPIVGGAKCVLSYQPKATQDNPSPQWKIYPHYIKYYYVGYGGSAYYAEAIVSGGFDLYGESVTIHRLLQSGKALRNYFTLGNGDLTIQHVSHSTEDKNKNGVVFYAVVPQKYVRMDTEWGFDHTEAGMKFWITSELIKDIELLALIKERCIKEKDTRFDEFIRYDGSSCQRYLSHEEMSHFEQRDRMIVAKLKSSEFFTPAQSDSRSEDYLNTEIVNAKIRCPISKVDALSNTEAKLEGKARCYMNYSTFDKANQKNVWHFFPYFISFHYEGTGSFMEGVAAKGELEGEFGFLPKALPVKLRDLFGHSEIGITNGIWMHHGTHNIKSKKGNILLALRNRKYGSTHTGEGIAWDVPIATSFKPMTRLLSEKFEIQGHEMIDKYNRTFNTYLKLAKRDCRLLALAKNEMSGSECSKSTIIDPQGRLVLKSLNDNFNFYSFSHDAGSIPLPEMFDYSHEPKVNYALKLLDLTIGKNYRRMRDRLNKR